VKKFIVFIVKFFFLTLILLVVLDVVYTYVYNEAEPRTKFQYLKSLQNSKINYVFLGSSRVDNGIVPTLIENATDKKTVNLGYQAAKISDVYTILKLLKAYNIVSDTVFIEVSYNFNDIEGASINLPYEMAPFFRDNQITRDYLNISSKSTFRYCFPFVRYCEYEAKIGIRELFVNLIHKKTKIKLNQGYNDLQGVEREDGSHRSLPKFILSRNRYVDKIKKFGKENGIQIIFFSAPFCKHIENLDYMKKIKLKIPELYDFSMNINSDKMFINCYHLNEEGANEFTKNFIKTIFNNNVK